MITNYAKHKAKANRLNKKYLSIQAKRPDFNFKDMQLRHDMDKFWKVQKAMIYAEVDANACKSDNPDFMCSDCNCWKQTRANCS